MFVSILYCSIHSFFIWWPAIFCSEVRRTWCCHKVSLTWMCFSRQAEWCVFLEQTPRCIFWGWKIAWTCFFMAKLAGVYFLMVKLARTCFFAHLNYLTLCMPYSNQHLHQKTVEHQRSEPWTTQQPDPKRKSQLTSQSGLWLPMIYHEAPSEDFVHTTWQVRDHPTHMLEAI